MIDIETCFNYTEVNNAFFSSNEKRWITQIHRLKQKFPDEVEIIREPEDNDGTIYARLPARALRLSLTKRAGKPISPEQLERMAQAKLRKQTEKTG